MAFIYDNPDSIAIIFLVVAIIISILLFIFWIAILVDALKREFPNPNDKTVWILVILLTSFIGALVYYYVVKKKSHNL